MSRDGRYVAGAGMRRSDECPGMDGTSRAQGCAGATNVQGWTVRRGRRDAQERRMSRDGRYVAGAWMRRSDDLRIVHLLKSRLNPGVSVQDTLQVHPCKLDVRHPCLPTVLDGHPGIKTLRGRSSLVALFRGELVLRCFFQRCHYCVVFLLQRFWQTLSVAL